MIYLDLSRNAYCVCVCVYKNICFLKSLPYTVNNLHVNVYG